MLTGIRFTVATFIVLLALSLSAGGAQAHAEATEPNPRSGEWSVGAVWPEVEGIKRPFATIMQGTIVRFQYPRCCYSEAPVSLVVAGDGTLWLADAGNSQLEHYEPATGILTYYGMLPWPVEVGAGANGAAWVRDTWTGYNCVPGSLCELPTVKVPPAAKAKVAVHRRHKRHPRNA